MGHGLTQTDRAAFAIKPAWHGLGVTVDHAMSSAEALKLANLDWEVWQQPATYYNPVTDQYSEAPKAFVNFRADTGDALGVVGNRYEIVQNRVAFDFLDGLVSDGSIEYESAFSLEGGRTVCVLARTPEDTQVAGEHHKRYILFKTSHDGTESIKIVPTDVRVVCQNTMRVALRGQASASIRHTRSAHNRLALAQNAMGDSLTAFEGYKQSAEMLATVKLSDDKFLEYINQLVPKVEERGRSQSIADNKRQAIFMAYYHDAKQTQSDYPKTLLAAFNSVTQTADHFLPKNRTAEKRFAFSQTGGGQTLKDKAWDTANEFAELIGQPVRLQVPAMSAN